MSDDHQSTKPAAPAADAVSTDTGKPQQTDDQKAADGLRTDLVKQRQRNAELEAKLQELSKPKVEPKDEEPAASKATETPSLEDRMAQIERTNRLTALEAKQGLTPDQAEIVSDLLDQTPGLSEAEATQLAKMRNPKSFERDDTGASGFDAATHGSTTPSAGQPAAEPEEPDMPKRLEAIKALKPRDKRRAGGMLNELVGSIAADQLGLKKLDRSKIPK